MTESLITVCYEKRFISEFLSENTNAYYSIDENVVLLAEMKKWLWYYGMRSISYHEIKSLKNEKSWSLFFFSFLNSTKEISILCLIVDYLQFWTINFCLLNNQLTGSFQIFQFCVFPSFPQTAEVVVLENDNVLLVIQLSTPSLVLDGDHYITSLSNYGNNCIV